MGELAGFRLGPGTARSRSGAWRAALGQAWHEELRMRVSASHIPAQGELLTPSGDPAPARLLGPEELPAAEGFAPSFEVPITGVWLENGWRLHLTGRIDQVLAGPDEFRLREVKTIDHRLPDDADLLRDSYPAYLSQAAIYAQLAEWSETFSAPRLTAEVVFVDIREGTLQIVEITANDRSRADEQAALLVTFLEARRARRQSWKQVRFLAPFPEWREGQQEAAEALSSALAEPRPVLFEAPTGFGKTGVVLQAALRLLQTRQADRLVYLSSKRSGQAGVVAHVRKMIGGDDLLSVHLMRSRAETARGCPLLACDHGRGCRNAVGDSGVPAPSPDDLFSSGVLDQEKIRNAAGLSGVCPYELARSALPYADVWIGDANYVFSPMHAGVFGEQPDFDPARSVLLIDEAHHLPERVAGALSTELLAGPIHRLHDESGESSHAFRFALEEIVRFLDRLPARSSLDLREQYHLRDLLGAFAAAAEDDPPRWRELPPELADAAENLLRSAALLEDDAFEVLVWTGEAGSLRLSVLDAAKSISATLHAFHRVVLMSATLAPMDDFAAAIGLPPGEAQPLHAAAPWRANACRVAVDTRVDTRFQHRERFYRLTAETTVALARTATGPVAVFFPSYRYAETVLQEVESLAPGLRVASQPRGLDTDGQEAFLADALRGADLLFLVLGGSFAEGIDPLGGRVTRAMVVGPALPEVNPLQKARLESREPHGRDAAFREVYVIPGMRKVNQALGRLIRAPGHTATILLHGQRFAQPLYQDLLALEYAPATTILHDADLEAWLG